MRTKSLYSYFFLLCFSLSLLFVGVFYFGFFHQNQNFNYLLRKHLFQAILSPVSTLFEELLRKEKYSVIEELGKSLSHLGTIRLQIMLTNGKEYGDSELKNFLLENPQNNLSSIVNLLQVEGINYSEGYDSALQSSYCSIMQPLWDDKQLAGLLIVRININSLLEITSPQKWRTVLWILFSSFVLSSFIAIIAARRMGQEFSKISSRLLTNSDTLLPLEATQSPLHEVQSALDIANDIKKEFSSLLNLDMHSRSHESAILGSMAEGVIALDSSGRVLTVNQAAIHILDIPNFIPSGQRIEELLRNYELLSYLLDSLSGIAPEIREFSLLYPNKRDVIIQCSQLKNREGRSTGLVVVIRDVSELKRLAKIQKDFVANVSHELRTPVTAIKGFTENLLDEVDLNTQTVKNQLSHIDQQAERLTAIIEDLLQLAKIEQETSRDTIVCLPTNPRLVIEQALKSVEHQRQKKKINITVNCNISRETPLNASLVSQALVNLLDNAIKYSSEQSEIKVMAEEDAGFAIFSVEDSGCGIPLDKQPRVFERFFVVDKARSRSLGGTGLGLAIVKSIVDAHNGKCWLESLPGKGCKFFFKLPLS